MSGPLPLPPAPGHRWYQTDLPSSLPVYTVVTYLKNEMNRGDFFMTLRNQPVALSLYRQVLLLFLLFLSEDVDSVDWLGGPTSVV